MLIIHMNFFTKVLEVILFFRDFNCFKKGRTSIYGNRRSIIYTVGPKLLEFRLKLIKL